MESHLTDSPITPAQETIPLSHNSGYTCFPIKEFVAKYGHLSLFKFESIDLRLSNALVFDEPAIRKAVDHKMLTFDDVLLERVALARINKSKLFATTPVFIVFSLEDIQATIKTLILSNSAPQSSQLELDYGNEKYYNVTMYVDSLRQ